MKIPLAKTDIIEEDIQVVTEVLKSGWIMQGPCVEAFEKAIAQFCHVPYAVATSSGTTALHLALQLIGVQRGDEVIVPSFSFIASANAIQHCGAKPVFCDVDLETYNMDLTSVERLITPRTKAIMVVHQFGMPCDLDAFAILAKKHRLEIVEDAACAIGSRYHNHPIGSCSHARVSCLSFHPRKILTTGEGGMILLREDELTAKARLLRNHGMKSAESFTCIGYNYRMTDFQAALGVKQISRLPQTLARRRALVARYQSLLSQNSNLIFPKESKGRQSNFQSLMIRLHKNTAWERDRIADQLASAGIATRKSIPPIHQQPCYTATHGEITLPQTEDLAAQGLILPLFSTMQDEEVDFVCKQIQTAI